MSSSTASWAAEEPSSCPALPTQNPVWQFRGPAYQHSSHCKRKTPAPWTKNSFTVPGRVGKIVSVNSMESQIIKAQPLVKTAVHRNLLTVLGILRQ